MRVSTYPGQSVSVPFSVVGPKSGNDFGTEAYVDGIDRRLLGAHGW